MKIREFKPFLDYALVCSWWKAHNWPVVPLPALPTNGFVAINDDGERLCAGWLYLTDSALSALEWMVSDPNSGAEERDAALDILITTLKARADEVGKPVIFSSVAHPKLRERLAKHGFNITDNGVTNMLRVVGAQAE